MIFFLSNLRILVLKLKNVSEYLMYWAKILRHIIFVKLWNDRFQSSGKIADPEAWAMITDYGPKE